MADAFTVKGRYGSYVCDAKPLATPGNARLHPVRDDSGLLYKQFPIPLDGAHVARLVALAEVGQATLDERGLTSDIYRIGWPLDLESRRVGATSGVIIRRAGPEFHRRGGLMPRAQSFGHLIIDPPPAQVRIEVMRQLAGALRFMKGHKLVHGDISANNVLWRGEPDVELMLIDCDGMYELGFPASSAYTPHWGDPRLSVKRIECHDQRSDWYALALAVYRVLVLEQRADPVAALQAGASWADIPPPLDAMLQATFADPLSARNRPEPVLWQQALAEVASSPPTCAEIDRAFSPPRLGDRPRVREPAPAPRSPVHGERPGAVAEARTRVKPPSPPASGPVEEPDLAKLAAVLLFVVIVLYLLVMGVG